MIYRAAFTVVARGLLPGLITLLVGLAYPTGAPAQERPPLWLVTTADTVLIQIAQPPATNHGFVIDRIGPDGAVERITTAPVFPVRAPGLAAAILGNDLPQLMELLETGDETQLLRRLQADRFTAGVSSILFRGAAVVLGRFYADTTARPGTSYEYRVTFLDHLGAETSNRLAARVTVADRLPAAPHTTTGQAGNAEARLAWRYASPHDVAHDFVLGFQIERAVGDGEFRRLTELPHLRTDREFQEYIDLNVNNGWTYRYRVRAVDLAGRLSGPGAVITVQPFDDRPPLSPQDLVTEGGDGRVRLAWRMSPELNVTGYHVERSAGLDQPFTRIVNELIPVTSPAWTDLTVRGGTQYFYRVVAINDQGKESRPSNAIPAVPFDETPPAPPAGLAATVVDRQIRIRWEPSPSDDVLGYHIYRGDGPDHAVRLTTRPHEALEYIDLGYEGAGLNPGRRYIIRVSAVDHSYNESPAIETIAEIPDDEPPAAPTALQLRNVEGRLVEISWSSGGSLDVEYYRLTRYAGAAQGGAGAGGTGGAGGTAVPVQIGIVPASGALRLRDEAVERGVEYRYHLVAVDSAGNISEPTEAGLQFRRFAAPPSSRRVVVRVVEGGVRVSWERVVDDELAGYRVYRADLPTGVYEPVSELITPDLPLEFTDQGGRLDHYYMVRAVDRSGNESRPSPAARAGGA